MDAKIVKLDKLLHEYTVFGIPIIQRRFQWGKEQINQLMDDVIMKGKDNESRQYLLGTIIVRESEEMDLDGISYSILYEGQQRFISDSLIYYALYLFLQANPELIPKELGNPEVLLEYVFNDYENTKTKLQLNSTDKVDYQKILAKEFEGNESHMYNMFKIIQKRINKTNYMYVLRGLRKLKVILTILGPEDDADEIFDTVNTRGKELSPIDQLRNVCLLNLEQNKQKEIYQNKWEPFYDSFIKYEFDKMITDWSKGLSILHSIVRPEKANSSYIIKHFRSRDSLEAMDTILDYNNILINMIEKSKHKKQVSQLLKIESLSGIVGIYLIEQAQENEQITYHEMEHLIRLVTSYVVRSWIMGERRHIPILVWNLSSYILSNSLNLYQDILSLFKNNTRKWERFPSDNELMEILIKKEWKKNKDALIMLSLIENELNVRCGDLSRMSLEHILPIKDSKIFNEELKIKRLLGNLTLIPAEENSRLSNNDFLAKKQMKGGFNESTFMIDEYIKQQNKWGEPEINERTKLLSQKILGLWPDNLVEC